MKKRHYFYLLPMILLPIVAVAGWFVTDYLGNKARQEIIGESQASVLTLSTYVSSTLNHFEGTVKSLAGADWIAPALISMEDQDIVRANSTLDRYNSAMNASVTYLMDADGMTVASSNRNDPDSFVRKSYRFRPYFQAAAKGQSGHYFALGMTSGNRGFYASYPVQNRLGKVLGVVAMKKDIDEMETFFRQYPFCFIISPDGIIFLSSRPAMVLKSLWPLDKTAQEKLIASQQFGNKLSEAIFIKKEIADGTEVTLEGKDYFVSRKVIDSDGWSIVLLTPTDRVWIYKVIGIMATLGTCSLIMFFAGFIYLTDRSHEAIRQSEEGKRLLLHAVREGIFGVDATGQVTFINPAALRVLGFALEEMLGQSVHNLIQHSHKDGSNYPVEDCPMYASYTKATENHLTEEVLWRKDGSSFPVEYSSMPIIRDDKILGAVVAFRDITERKLMDEALKKREVQLNEMGRTAKVGGWEFDTESEKQVWTKEVFRIHEVDENYEPTVNRGIEFYIPASRPVIEKAVQRAIEHGEPFDVELEIMTAKGNHRWVHATGNAHRENGITKKVSGIFQDITERKQEEEALRESEKRFMDVFYNSEDAILLIDGQTFVDCNEATTQMLGYSGQHEFLMTHPSKLSPPAQPDGKSSFEKANEMMRIASEKGFHRFEWMHQKANGENFPVEVSLTPIALHGKTIIYCVWRDVTDRRLAEEKIQQLVYHDTLTGLPNRRLFSDRLCIALAQAQRNKNKVGVVMLDLDKFKDVNDTLGHDVGDLLLKAAAERLSAALRKGDTVARFGGDEFVLILPDLEVIEDAIQAAQKIVNSFCKPFLIGAHQLVVTTSIGIAVYPIDGTDEGILLKNADIAMYQAKQAGRARYQLYKEA